MRAADSWLITVASLGLAACRFDAELVEGYRCGDGDRCASGLMCVDGFCVSDAPDAGNAPDAAVEPDADPANLRCGTIALLRDDFADTVRAPQWDFFEDTGATIAETGGHLAVQFTAGTGSPYAGYTSSYRYDLTGSAFVAEVSQIAGGDTNTILEVRNYTGARAQVVGEAGELVAGVYGVATSGTLNAIPYDATAQRFWRIRESMGVMYWEYSADGTAWEELHSQSSPFPIEHVRGIVSAGEQIATPTEARFEAVNPDEAPAGYCPASTLVDDFAATPLEPLWDFWMDANCTLTETGGVVQMTFATGVGSTWCGIASRHILELTDAGIYVDAMGVGDATRFVNYFQVITPYDFESRAEINREGGSIGFVQRIDGIDVNRLDETYNATNDRYWKIARSGTTILFQTSPDATTWTTRFSPAALFDLTQVAIVIGNGHYDPGPGTPVTSLFRGVNTP